MTHTSRLRAVTPLNVVLFVLAGLQARFFTVFEKSRIGVHVEAVGWDYDIPFVPGAVLPYISVYALLAVTVVVLIRRGDPWRLSMFLLSFVLVWGVADFVWSAYPTVNVIRPDHLGDTVFERLVALNYGPGRDTLPSGHNFTAWLCAFTLIGERARRAWAFVVWAAAISISTMLVRQHYLVDVAVSIPLAFVVCRVVDRALTHQLRTTSPNPEPQATEIATYP